jgi:hypothetical protein
MKVPQSKKIAAQFLFAERDLPMNGENQKKQELTESISRSVIEANSPRPQETHSATPDGPPKKRRNKYDGSRPLDFPGDEAVAQFFAAPKQCRQFKSVSALAEHFDVTRPTIYRWAHDRDLLKRTEWLAMRNRGFGDFIACREWPGIVKAQVAAALAGDTRAAFFSQNRVWPDDSMFRGFSFEAAMEGAINIETFLEADETPGSEELGSTKESPETVDGKNLQE